MVQKSDQFIKRAALVLMLCFSVVLPSYADLATAQQAWKDKNYTRAFALFSELAGSGNAKAMNNLAALYQYGQGAAKDLDKAVYWYKKAIKAGNAAAMTNLGYLYDNGLGVSKDPQQAYKLYRKAAEKGHAQGQYNLGVAYFQGTGVVRNRVLGYAWIGVAASQGLGTALKTMKMLDYRMPPMVVKDGREMIPKFYERFVVPYKEQPQ